MSIVDKDLYYINTNEIPGQDELLHENMIMLFSHVKRSPLL